MIGEHLDLKGQSLIQVMLPRTDPEEPGKIYDRITTRIIQKLHTFLAQYIENEEILKKLHTCKTIQDLEGLQVKLIYPSLFADLAEELNTEEDISDSERTYLLANIADRMIAGAQDWYQQMGQQRAQAIAAGKGPGKILGMDGKKAKPGKIIH